MPVRKMRTVHLDTTLNKFDQSFSVQKKDEWIQKDCKNTLQQTKNLFTPLA